jgi:hypothetical protein
MSLAAVAIIEFSLYTLGSYSISPKAGTKVQPVRISASTPAGIVSNNKGPQQQQGNLNSKLSFSCYYYNNEYL